MFRRQHHNALVAPPSTTRKRRGNSCLDPVAPELVSPAAVPTHGELDPLICYRIHPETLNNLIEGPFRDYIHSRIAAKEAERKKALEWFTSVKAQLDVARVNMAKVAGRPAPYHEPDDTGLYSYITKYDLMEQEIIELELSWDDAGRTFTALGEEIEGLWGELAIARR